MNSIQPDKVNGKELVQSLSDLFIQVVKIDHIDPPKEHPIILLNAVKNIIGDDRDNPSDDLYQFSKIIIDSFSTRKDDESLWENVKADGVGLTVFTDEVERAVMTGNRDDAEGETARQIMASNNSPAILELLAELAIHNVDDLGLFTFHWLRSYYFHQNEKELWSYARCIISEMFKCELVSISNESDLAPESLIHKMITPSHMKTIPLFSAMIRLWDGDYVRIKTFKNAISGWLNAQRFNRETTKNSSTDKLEKYHLHGGRYFIDIAESIVKNNPPNEAIHQIVHLEALRGIAKNAGPESFQQIANCINFIVRKS
ncbi:MAG: hypothetical protein IIB95_01320 [Candidatus Marinimicrobia bacterium]|nr:hypothetical protein [Candidatus Neomarinimicrobiota bacterium]